MSESTEAGAVDSSEADEDTEHVEVLEEPQPDVDQDDSEAEESPNAEAAKWRRQLRDAEAERDTLSGRVDALQRRQIEAQVAAAGVKPAAVWKTSELAELIAEDGTVDANLVAAAIDTARQELGIQPISKGVHVPGVGQQPSGLPKTDEFADAFKPRRAR